MKHFVFGGRFGDICHSLPAVYEYAKRTGTRPRFTSSEEFASILDGCSYIEAYAAPCRWEKIQDIVQYARSLFPNDEFVVMACYGHDYNPGYENWSFLRDSWRLSQCPTPPESQPLVFDKRDPVREQELCNIHLRGVSRKFILLCTAGRSSPFQNSQMLLADIQASRPDCDVVDISQARAHRVYDMLALMEKAEALVTIDTMHLHLAAAVPNLPVFALICNGPTQWNRTDWRPQQYWRSTYAEYVNMRGDFRETLASMISYTPTIRHVWSVNTNASPDTKRRELVALKSWEQEPWLFSPVDSSRLPRLHEDNQLPYVHDLIEYAAEGLGPRDVISFSNSDVGCVHGITGQIIDAVREFGCTFAHRWDSQQPIETPIQSEAAVGKLSWYPGSDWFWMSVKWWKAHSSEFPDMIIGREFWDAVMRQLMKKHGTREIQRGIWHEKHPSFWEQPGNRQNLPGNNHNRALAQQWFSANRSDAQDPFRSTWNIVPGVTQPVMPSERRGTRTPASNIVLPTRLVYHQNTVPRCR